MQDRVPAFSPEKARAFIQSEMGCPIEVIFKEFEDRPIAAASLGQVLSSYFPLLYVESDTLNLVHLFHLNLSIRWPR